ncbi:MAG: DUF975 family protein [Clostridia bacterium]|nr:DUF975 family protein [Clostridia bacterium]
MRAKDYRQSAWQSLKGKWGVCVLAFLIFDLISGACAGSYANDGTAIVFSIAGLIVMGPLTIGLSAIGLNAARDKEVEMGMLFNGFKDFGRSWVLYFTNNLFIILWTMLFVIPGIIKTFAYSMSYYILIDNPTMSASQARKKSIEMMKGNKWRLFCLEFSFIGWLLLSLLTLGILLFWVMPYMEVARAKFYLSLLPEEEVQDSVVNGDIVDVDGNVNSEFDNNNAGANDFDAFANDDKAQNADVRDEFDFSSSDDEFK